MSWHNFAKTYQQQSSMVVSVALSGGQCEHSTTRHASRPVQKSRRKYTHGSPGEFGSIVRSQQADGIWCALCIHDILSYLDIEA